jgi:hypothetical protein
MVEQKSSLLERLKVCWNVLTKKNYVYFGIGREPVIWSEDGKYKEIDKKQVRCYSCITYDYQFNTKNGITNLHDFTWGVIEKFAIAAQNVEY